MKHTMVLTGDVNLRNVTDPDHPFALVAETLHASDIVFGNLEGCLYDSDDELPYKQGWRQALAEAHDVRLIPHRQEFVVAPQVWSAPLELGAVDVPRGLVQVVPGEQHLAAVGAGPRRLIGRQGPAAPRALEMAQKTLHGQERQPPDKRGLAPLHSPARRTVSGRL